MFHHAFRVNLAFGFLYKFVTRFTTFEIMCAHYTWTSCVVSSFTPFNIFFRVLTGWSICRATWPVIEMSTRIHKPSSCLCVPPQPALAYLDASILVVLLGNTWSPFSIEPRAMIRSKNRGWQGEETAPRDHWIEVENIQKVHASEKSSSQQPRRSDRWD